MQVTCEQKSAEKVYSSKCYLPKFDFCIFFPKKHIADIAATSNAANVFLMRQQNNSVTLSLKIVSFDQRN